MVAILAVPTYFTATDLLDLLERRMYPKYITFENIEK